VILRGLQVVVAVVLAQQQQIRLMARLKMAAQV
jgi:hypothetical protein